MHSLDLPILSTTQRLAVSTYRHPNQAEGSPIFQRLSSMKALRILILIKCDSPPFLCASNPEENTQSTSVLCPNLEELVLYIEFQDDLRIEHLISMAKNRASAGAMLSSITIVGLDGLTPGMQAPELEEHVTRVMYRVDEVPPAWDHVPGESGDRARGL